MIFENSLNMSVVKLFMKNIRRQDFRISLKNLSRISCVVELGIIKNDKLIKVGSEGLTEEYGLQFLPAANYNSSGDEHEFHNDGAVTGSSKQK